MKSRAFLSPEDRTYVRRLRKLANHLRTKRGHDKFDFDIIVKQTKCGTAGCAVGELPFCFPREFTFLTDGLGNLSQVIRRGEPADELWRDVANFFGLSQHQRVNLFIGDWPTKLHIAGLRPLSRKASATAVANNLDRFCDLVESGEQPIGLYR